MPFSIRTYPAQALYAYTNISMLTRVTIESEAYLKLFWPSKSLYQIGDNLKLFGPGFQL
jgi:hypothetical protein